jgi:hypothetical protein
VTHLRSCDGAPTTIERLLGDQITTLQLGTAPPALLEIRRIMIIAAAAAGQSVVVLSIRTVTATLELIPRYHLSRMEFSSHVG